MKYFIKGIFLGLSLNAANILCDIISSSNFNMLTIVSPVIFFLVTAAFLVSDKVSNLLLCGFTGLFAMFFWELFVFAPLSGHDWLFIYFCAVGGSFAAIPVSIILTVKGVKILNYIRNDNIMTTELKIKYLIYLIISALSFSYLVLPEKAGISVPLFVLIQFVCLFFLSSQKKKLVMLIPIFLISLNSFISGSSIWRTSNIIVCILLYSCMFIDLDFKKDSLDFIVKTIANFFSAFLRFPLPFKWVLELNSQKAPIIKRVAIALAVAIPCAVVLIITLSNADMVFSLKTTDFIKSITGIVSANTLTILMFGAAVGLFLFGILCNSYDKPQYGTSERKALKGDLLIINITLGFILFIYTLFVIIQFKYLFAGATLPHGLSFTEYARKGFFELLALTGINIAIILIITKITKTLSGRWHMLTKIFCHYLCAVTVILLISSFYRMLLYTADDGLTRLRLFVMGFLVFEAAGLVITFLYIRKPKFNIVLVYTSIALTYYVLLNIVPTDNIIARNQIDKYLSGERTDIDYIFTLSSDAAPSMNYLLDMTDDKEIQLKAEDFIKRETKSDIPARWQRFNISTEYAKHQMN